jgi:hypothetical protein
MALLENPRHEAFAQARARGVSPDQAYEDAGFVPGHNHASRLSMRPEIAERIAEVRAQLTHLDEARTHGVISALLRAAKASEATPTAAALKEIRLTLLEAHRLHDDLEIRGKMDRRGVLRAE